MRAIRKDLLQRIRWILAIAAVLLAWGAAKGDEPDEADFGSPDFPPLEESVVAADKGAEIPEAIHPGTVREGMTRDQVRSARGTPLRTEVIPPDAELWHYAEGEVAFSQGKVSYVGLDRAPVPTAPSQGATREEAAAEKPKQKLLEEPRGPDTARVHTPGDGFLALRSEPTTSSGRRILKIPHGSVLTLDQCVSRPNDGRWCKTTFKGRVGWVFERYLVR